LTRFNFDAPLIAVLWRPETHMFHFSVGEMTLSLEHAAMLGGLSCARQAMGPIDIPETWQAEFLARFANGPRNDHAPAPYLPFVDPTGPPGLGFSSSAYVILTLSFSVCMHLNECDDRPLRVCRLTTWQTMPTTRCQCWGIQENPSPSKCRV
jgi:hypothetical protein